MPSRPNSSHREPNTNRGSDPGQRTGRSGTRGGRVRQKWNPKSNKNTFNGKTREMNGNVFQLQVEQKRKGQYQETLDQLQVYAVNMYRKDIKVLKVLFTDLKKPTKLMPLPVKNPSTVEDILFKEEVKQYTKDKRSLESTLVSLYNVVWGQCSKLLQNKLKANPKYDDFNNSSDVVMLLKEIKLLSNKIEENASSYDALHEAKTKLYRYQQGDNDSLADHMRNFKDLCNSVEYHGGDTFFDETMKENEIRADVKDDIPTDSSIDGYRNRVIGKAKAVAFLKSANRKTYGKLLMSIREQHSFKIDVYPKTLADAYEMLSAHTPHNNNSNSVKHRKENRNNNTSNTSENHSNTTSNTNNNDVGTTYLQTNAIPGTNGRLIQHITCYNCRRKGHYADNCPEDEANQNDNQQHIQLRNDNNSNISTADTEMDEQLMQVEHNEHTEDIVHFSWTQVSNASDQKYKDTDILIDTGSMFSVFKNPQMLLNIRPSERKMKAYTNGGRQDSTLVGELPGFFEVWHNPQSMINILAFADVADKFRITSDTAKGRFITVHLSENRRMNFFEVESGLYLFRDRMHTMTSNKLSGYSYLMLTEANMSEFSKVVINKAQQARELHRAMGFPSYNKFLLFCGQNKFLVSELLK